MLQFLLPVDTQSSSTRALKPAQERDRARRAAETSEQRSEKAKGERLYYRHAVKQLVKDKLLYNGKVHERGAETPDFNSTRTATQLLLPPHTGYYSITLTHDPVKLQHRNKPLLNYITKPGNTSACAQMPYYQNSYPISRCMLGLLPINTVSSPGVGLQRRFLER